MDFSVVVDVVSALAASGLLGAVLGPLAVFGYKFLVSKLPTQVVRTIDQDMATIEHVTQTVVQGIEQYAGPKTNGDDKRTEALRLINEILSKQGISVDPNHVEMALQQAVYVMNQAKAADQEVLAKVN